MDQPPPVPAKTGTSPWVWVGVGCASLAGLAILGGILVFALFLWLSPAQWVETTPEVLVEQVVAEMNKRTPMMVDEVTRLDRTEVGPGLSVIYYYTTVGVVADQVTPEALELVRDTAVENYRTNPEMEAFRLHGVSLVYVYEDENGRPAGRFTVAPEDLEP